MPATEKKKLTKQQLKQFSAAVADAKDSAKTWPDFWNAVGGIGGPIARIFPTQEERVLLSQSDEYRQFTDHLAEMQKSGNHLVDQVESASGAIALRLPKSMHAALKVEAEAEDVSVNQLILAKLAVQLRTACSA